MEAQMQSPRFIDTFVPLVHFLGEFLGNNCEVVLHDVSAKENSALAIANGHISGRKAGAPLTDLALRFVMDGTYRTNNWITGYRTVAKDGTPLHSATYFIKDAAGELHGMLCLNMDTSDILEAKRLLERIVDSGGIGSTTAKPSPTSSAHEAHATPYNAASVATPADHLKKALAGKCIVTDGEGNNPPLVAHCGISARNDHPETPPPVDSEDAAETYEANRNVPDVAAQIGQARHRGNTLTATAFAHSSPAQTASTQDTRENIIPDGNSTAGNSLQSGEHGNHEPHHTAKHTPFSTRTERFSQSLEELTDSLIHDTVTQTQIAPERMTPAEKQQVVANLHEKGVFLLKGAVHSVAKALCASEATIYRYLQKIAEQAGHSGQAGQTGQAEQTGNG